MNDEIQYQGRYSPQLKLEASAPPIAPSATAVSSPDPPVGLDKDSPSPSFGVDTSQGENEKVPEPEFHIPEARQADLIRPHPSFNYDD